MARKYADSHKAKEGQIMARLLLTDEEWDLIADVFPKPAATGRPPRDPRQVVDGILWILRTGSPWRDLPAEFGPWQTAWRLFDQWNSDGTLNEALQRLQTAFIDIGEIDNDLWCIDGTIVRAARCAGGGGKKGTLRNQLIMR
jgi:transposase